MGRAESVAGVLCGAPEGRDPGFRFHNLRHTFASRLVQTGVDLYTVQRLGRWNSMKMVQHYGHHYPESLRSGAEVLDRLRAQASTK